MKYFNKVGSEKIVGVFNFDNFETTVYMDKIDKTIFKFNIGGIPNRTF